MTDAQDVTILRNMWYLAALGRDLKPGAMQAKEIAGEPVLLARGKDGKAFALRNICPHRGIPLSHGRLCGKGDVVDRDPISETQVECCYHGWRFGTDGHCRAVPSLVTGHGVDIDKIRVRSFPLVERQGLLWVYISARKGDEPLTADASDEPAIPAPEIPGVGERQPGLVIRQTFDTDVDQAVIGLLDPAHGPYVHRGWWWRTGNSMHDKEKHYIRAPLGFVMKAHKPSKNSFFYRLLGGDLTTEIGFALPGLRTELIRSPKGAICGMTFCTPIAGGRTETSQIFYWTMPWVGVLKPLVSSMGQMFLGQDRKVFGLQQEGLRYGPRTMLIKDADTLAQWYLRLKREWTKSHTEGVPFENPVPEEATLRWRT